MNTVICGCARNCEAYLDDVFENIRKIQNILNVKKIVVAYDDSSDKTLFKLCQLKKQFNLEILVNKESLTSERTQNICNARNKMLNYINNLDYQVDYFIMIDLDDVCSKPINIEVLKEALNETDKWDGLTFNNERYYDFWALSIGDFQYSCWHWNNPYEVIKLMYNHLKSQNKLKNGNYIECDSAFNGFGIYKYNMFNNCYYKSIIDNIELFDEIKVNDDAIVYYSSFYTKI